MAHQELLESVTDMNHDILTFQKKLKRFSKYVHRVDHQMIANMSNLVRQFQCLLQNKPYTFQVRTDESVYGSEKEEKMVSRFSYCSQCRVKIKDTYRCVQKHLESESHLENARAAQNRPRSQADLEATITTDEGRRFLATFDESLSENVMRAVYLQDRRKYRNVTQFLLDVGCLIDENVQLHLGGSRLAGFGSDDSNLDIFVNFGKSFGNDVDDKHLKKDAVEKLHQLVSLLPEDKWGVEFEKLKTRIPSVAIKYNDGLVCNLSTTNGLTTCSADLFAYFCRLQPVFRKLAIVVKQWKTLFLRQELLLGRYSSHSVILMLIFFLQSEHILPPITDLHRRVHTAIRVGRYRVNFAEFDLRTLKLRKHNDSISECRNLFVKFLKFYSKFRFDWNVMSLFLGTTIPKANFHQYFMEFAAENEFMSEEELQCHKLKCSDVTVQDPTELDRNVTTQHSSFLWRRATRETLAAMNINWE